MIALVTLASEVHRTKLLLLMLAIRDHFCTKGLFSTELPASSLTV